MFEIQSLVNFYELYGYIAVFGVLILCGFGLPSRGHYVVRGRASFPAGIHQRAAHDRHRHGGMLIGDSTVYNWMNIRRALSAPEIRRADQLTPRTLCGGQAALRPPREMGHLRGPVHAGLRTPIFATAGNYALCQLSPVYRGSTVSPLNQRPFWVTWVISGAHERDLLVPGSPEPVRGACPGADRGPRPSYKPYARRRNKPPPF